MTKDELEAEAKKIGLVVKTRFMSDWQDISIGIACGFGMGFIVGYFKLFRLFG